MYPIRGLRVAAYQMVVAIFAALTIHANAQPATAPPSCNVARSAVLTVPLPGNPFAAIASADGCTVYVSLMAKGVRGPGSIAALKRDKGDLSALRGVTLDRAPSGLVLTHDGSLLIAASGDGVSFLDPVRFLSGDQSPLLGHIDDGGKAATYVAVTQDDRFLFVSNERSQSISVVDLVKARSTGFTGDATIGQIPAGRAPVGLALSPDGNVLYATSEVIPLPGWPGGCNPEGKSGEHREGAILVIDVRRAVSDPSHGVARLAHGGCNPVRLALSPPGDRLYVTARDSNALLVFDTAKLLSGESDTPLARVPVGTSPVGVVATDSQIIVTNSDRFSRSGRSENQTLTVIDAAKISTGADAVQGTVEVGGFPRELHLTADGKTLLVANFGTDTLSVIDLAQMLIAPGK